MNIISTIFGIVGLILFVLTMFFPLLGAIGSWICLPIGILGLIFGAFSSKKSGRNINIVLIILSVFRLWLGGGIL